MRTKGCFLLLLVVGAVSLFLLLAVSSPSAPLLYATLWRRLSWGAAVRRVELVPESECAARPSQSRKLIVAWTPFFSVNLADMWVPASCAVGDACDVSSDRRLVERADAVVLHSRDMRLWDLPTRRCASQRFVFLLFESPAHTFASLRAFDGFFNWTMTYRRDSHVYAPYGELVRRRAPLSRASLARLLGSKPRDVVWFVSNCKTDSKREAYAAELRKHVAVDVFGACGRLACDSSVDNCSALTTGHYRFAIVFENSVCRDYVTEKFFNALRSFVVPIVLRRSVVPAEVPSEAFLAADDFNSPAALAEYIVSLRHDAAAFMRFFDWHFQFELASHDWMCTLCKTLHSASNQTTSVDNLHSWWFDGGQCFSGYAENLI